MDAARVEETERIARCYFAKFRRGMSDQKMQTVEKMLDSGLTADEICRAMDEAVVLLGWDDAEWRYWEKIQQICRAIWKKNSRP